MADVNACVVSGRLTRDPEACPVTERGPSCKFSLANNQGYGDNEKVQYINVAVWGKRGETCLEYLRKGAGVTVVGPLFQRKYQTADGEDKASLDMKGNDVVFGPKAATGDRVPDAPSEPIPPADDDSDIPF